MFEIEKSFNFEAGHSMVHHDGKCKEPHGHSYLLTIVLRSSTLISQGCKKNMVMDFGDISSTVKPMIEKYFDHKWLNDTLETDSPSTEFLTKWIYNFLKSQLPLLYAVSIKETHSSKVTYWE